MAQNLVEYILDIKTKAAEQGLDKVVDALEDVEKELKRTQKESQKTTDNFEKFKKAGIAVGKVTAVMAAVGVAVLAAGKAAFEASRRVTDLVNELNDLSVRSGVSSKTIQGLRQAMISSGQSAEGLTEVLGAISGQFAQLGIEGSAVEKKFLSFGVAVRDANGDLRSNNDILLDGIKLLQGISDASERSRAAVALFGEAGAKLNQALAAGDFQKFLSFTEKFGIDTGPQASKAAAHFQVVLSGLGTVLNGTLQKFVTATDGQNRFIQGMIKLGGIIAFTGSLIQSFSGEIESLTDTILDLLKFGIKQMILVLAGPFAMALGSIVNNLELFGIEINFVNKAMSSLANFTIETVDPTNRLSNAIDKAKADMKEYQGTMETLNVSLNDLSSLSTTASVEVNELAKSTKNATDQARTFTEILSGIALGFGIKLINFDKLFSDSQVFAKGISRILKLQVAPVLDDIYIGTLSKALDLTVKLEQRLDKINWFQSIDTQKGKFFDDLDNGFMKVLNKFSKGLRDLIGGVAVKLSKMMKRDFGKNIANRLGNSFGELAGKFGSLVGGALSKALTVALPIIGVLLKIIGFASSLGQRGSTVKEVEKSVEEDIRARAKSIELGLQVLPRILFKVLPPLFVEFVDRLIFGLLKGFAEQFNIVISFFRSIFTKEGRQERRAQRDRRQEARGEEFRNRLEQLINIAGFRSGGRYLPSARGGIKFTGMQDQGLAMLHRGEFVVPETGQMPQAVQRTMGMGGSGINITINAAVVESNAVDELVRQIERRFQTFGSSTSPLFGGR
jgi:hypothetical protein